MADVVIPAVPAVPAVAPSPVPSSPVGPSGPFAVMSSDRFILKDTNNDGIPDTVIVEHVDFEAEAAARAEAAKYSAYHAAVKAAKDDAAKLHAGQSVTDILAAENVAEAKVKSEWSGPFPSLSKAEEDKIAADKAASDARAAQAAEVHRLSSLK